MKQEDAVIVSNKAAFALSCVAQRSFPEVSLLMLCIWILINLHTHICVSDWIIFSALGHLGLGSYYSPHLFSFIGIWSDQICIYNNNNNNIKHHNRASENKKWMLFFSKKRFAQSFGLDNSHMRSRSQTSHFSCFSTVFHCWNPVPCNAFCLLMTSVPWACLEAKSRMNSNLTILTEVAWSCFGYMVCKSFLGRFENMLPSKNGFKIEVIQWTGRNLNPSIFGVALETLSVLLGLALVREVLPNIFEN